MINVIDLPTRARPAPSRAVSMDFALSPRGRFEEHVNRLISLGHIGVGHAVLINYRDFSQPTAKPEPGAVGEILRLLLMVDQADPPAVRHARLAATALLAICFPFPEPTQPGAA